MAHGRVQIFKLIVFSGASGIGKSTILFRLSKTGDFDIAPKFSDRAIRKGHDDVVHTEDFYGDEIKCDIVYERYGNRYGICTKEIDRRLQFNNQLLIVSDIESLSRMRRIFGKRMIVVFVIPPQNSIEGLIEVSVSRGDLEISLLDKVELISIGRKLSELVTFNYQFEFCKLDELFRAKIDQCFANTAARKSFVARYESLISSEELLVKNRALFDCASERGEDLYRKLLSLV